MAAAREVCGPRAAEDVDYALRLAFFRDSVDVSAGAVRGTVRSDFGRSRTLPIQGSPQVFWPDGTTTHNPGMTDHEWVRGIPRIHSTDPDEPFRLLQDKVSA